MRHDRSRKRCDRESAPYMMEASSIEEVPPKVIIVEGPDGAGKTHLVDRLQKSFNLALAEKSVLTNTEPVKNLTDYVEQTLDGGLNHTIYDRHPIISEPIYAAALRHSLKPGFDDVRWLLTQQEKMLKLRPFIIYCLPKLETVERNVWDNSVVDNTIVQDKIRTIWGLYATQAARDALVGRALIHNYESDGALRRIQMILDSWLKVH